MAELREIYKCELCDNVVEVQQGGEGVLVCCGEDMTRLEAKTEDTGNEKHVPVIEETGQGVLVKVGDIEHPMEDDHFIKFIEVLTEDKVLKAELAPGEKPEATFNVDKSDIVSAREYCTVHELWKNEM